MNHDKASNLHFTAIPVAAVAGLLFFPEAQRTAAPQMFCTHH
jgi:hypothetical protein